MPRGHNGIDAVQVWPVNSDEGRICTVVNNRMREEANARLIASAPELLSELTDVGEWLNVLATGDLSNTKLEDVRALAKLWRGRIALTLAKATGEVPR